MLKLDPVQQQKTQQLLKQLADRYDAIQAEWAKAKRSSPRSSRLRRTSSRTSPRDPYAGADALSARPGSAWTIQSKLGGHSQPAAGCGSARAVGPGRSVHVSGDQARNVITTEPNLTMSRSSRPAAP